MFLNARILREQHGGTCWTRWQLTIVLAKRIAKWFSQRGIVNGVRLSAQVAGLTLHATAAGKGGAGLGAMAEW